jgi:hypothetical protein
VPAFADPDIYRRADAVCSSPTLAIRKVDDVACGDVASSDRDDVLGGICFVVYAVHSEVLMKLFYATDIEQCTEYIRVFALSYIESCITRLGW